MGTMTVAISGTSVMVLESSFEIDESISQTGTARFTVRDDSGSNHWTDGQPITITDSVTGLAYSGFVASSIEDRASPNPLIFSQVTSIDNSYLPGKRTYQGPEYTNTYAGAIVADLMNVLAAEGVTAQYASQRATSQTDFSGGTLTNVVGANNAGDGDLELALAGTQVTILEDTTSEFSSGALTNVVASNNTLSPVSTPALKITGTCSQPGSSNAYSYVKIWNGSQSVGTSDFLNYDIWIDPASPSGQIGVDIVFSDGTTWRDTSQYADVQSVYPHPNNDLTGLATGQWYHRNFWMTQYSGKTISFVTIALEGDKVGTYTGYVKNIYLQSSSNHYFFQNVLQMPQPQQMQNNGYDTTVVTVVNTYDLSGAYRTSNAYSVSAVGLLQSSNVTWNATVPAGTLFQLKYSLDGKAFYPCTLNSPLPNLPAATSLAGLSVYLVEEFTVDPTAQTPASPEVAPVLNSLDITLSPSYNTTKSDVFYAVDSNAAWAAGTFTDTTNNGGPNLTLNGVVRNWDNGDSSSQSLYTFNAQQGVNNRRFALNVPTGGEARSRMDFAGQFADGTMEVDILIDTANTKPGVVYRTTGWVNGDGTFAYAVEVTTTTLKLFKGGNGSGGITQLGPTVTLAVTSGNAHRLKVVFVGSSHSIYLDDVLYLNVTDSTYTAAGYVGLRLSNGTSLSYVALFDNFGICSNVTGKWVGPATSIAGAATYGTSVIAWNDISTDIGNTDTLLVETQVDGSTWQTATNGASIPNLTVGQSLTGVNLKIRVTLTTSTASTLPGIDYLTARIVGQLSATGNRVSPALSLTPVGRLGSSLVAWDDNLPGTGTSLQVKTSVDGGVTYQTATNGSPIPNLTATPTPWQDFFATNTAADYTQSELSGGGAAYWNWYTGYLQSTQNAGVNGILEYLGLSSADMAVYGDFNRSDSGGIVARQVDSSHAYFLSIADASAAVNANTAKLCKINGSGGGVTPLSVYGSDVAATTLTTAGKLATTTGGTSTTTNTKVGLSTGYGEIIALGTTSVWAAAGSIGSPSGKGWLLDSTLLASQQIVAGNWQPIITFTLGSGTSITADIYVRAYAYDSVAHTYTSIGSMVKTGQIIPTTATTFTFSTTSLSAFTFNANQMLYIDCWLDITSNSSGGTSANVKTSLSTSATSGVANDMQIGTPGYQAPGSGGVTVLSTVPINFVRGTYHRFVLDCQGTTISASMDGLQIASVTDSSITAAGTAAILSGVNTGDQIICTGFQVAPYGQQMSGISVQTKCILTTTDPLNTPQVLSLTLTAFGNTISPGALIPQTSISGAYIIDALNTLAKASNYWQRIDKNKVLWFQATTGVPSPWIASDNPGDFLDAGLTVEDSSTSYRNRQIVKNVLATVGQTLSKRGDNVSTSWTAPYGWASAPTITVNGIPATVGIKNVDTGRQFYWAVGDPTIVEDASGPTYDQTFLLSFIGLGQYLTNSQADNTSAQTARAAIDGTSGIVENTVDGTGLTKAQGDALAASLLLQYCRTGRLIKATTRRSGLAIGQLLPVFLAGHGIANGLYLIRALKTKLTTEFPNGTSGGAIQQGWYDIEAISGADVGDWTRLYQTSTV